MENLSPHPDSYRFAVALTHVRYRVPTGIAAFPDGGRHRVLEVEGRVFLLDGASTSVTELVRMEAPERMRHNFSIFVDGWSSGRVVFTITGCAEEQCRAGYVREHFAVSSDTPMHRLDAIPSNVVRQPVMGARAPGETTYMRVSTRSDTIVVRITDDGPYRPMYRIDPVGRITPLEP